MASLEEIRETRLKKLKKLRDVGMDPYPAKTARDFEISRLVAEFQDLQKENRTVTIAGRVMALRAQGKVAFADLFDGSSVSAQTGKFQILLRKGDGISDEDFDLFMETVDIGDFIETSGTLFVTKKKKNSSGK